MEAITWKDYNNVYFIYDKRVGDFLGLSISQEKILLVTFVS